MDGLAERLPYPRATVVALAIVLALQFFGLWQGSRYSHRFSAKNRDLIVQQEDFAVLTIRRGCEQRNVMRQQIIFAVEEANIPNNVVVAIRRDLQPENCENLAANVPRP